MKTIEQKIERNLREFHRLGLTPDYPLDLARDWAVDGRYSYAIPYIRNARGRVSFRNHWQPPTIAQRKAAYPSGLRLSGTLSDWLQRIAAGPNAKAARVAEALLSAASSRVSHSVAPFGNHFSVREREGLVSYCPANRTQGITADGRWERAGRVEIKPAKFARGVLRHPERFKDDEYAAFAEAFGGVEAGEKIAWDLVTTAAGFDEAYNAENWGADRSDATPHGITSCMWGEPVGAFYERAGARLLVGKQNGKFVARAVIWETQELGTVVDRLYAQPHIREAVIEYVFSQGWAKKEADRSGNSSWLMPDGSAYHRGVSVELAKSVEGCRFFPYIDTFQYQDGDVLYAREDSSWEYRYCCTTGGRDDNHAGQVQDVDGEWIDESDATCIDGDYYATHDDRVVYCHNDDEYILRADAYEVEVGGRIGTIYLHDRYVSRA
jgi:hypothetical protein